MKKKRSPKHLAFIRGLPCAMCNRPPPNHAHHSLAHKPGMSMKAADCETIPLCMLCHESLHNPRVNGPFKGWSGEKRGSWERAKVDLYNIDTGAFF